MFHPRAFTWLLVLAAALCAAGKDKDKNKGNDKPEGWLPVTQQDLAVKDVPNDPSADAIQLYMSYYKDENANFVAVYKRIKVLREGALAPGKALVDVEIPIEPGESLKELAARTTHPDQRTFQSTAEASTKVLIKKRGVRK